MKTKKIILKNILDITIDFTSDLLELGYSLHESFMYTLKFISNQRIKQNLSAEEYIELEEKYMQKVLAFA